MKINNVVFDDANPVTMEFPSWAALGDWWTVNPTAVRINPENNDNVVFPCEMTFVFPKTA